MNYELGMLCEVISNDSALFEDHEYSYDEIVLRPSPNKNMHPMRTRYLRKGEKVMILDEGKKRVRVKILTTLGIGWTMRMYLTPCSS